MPQFDNSNNDWRYHPATPAQLGIIRRNHLASDEECRGMTKGYASALLKAHMANRPDRCEGVTPAQIRLIEDLCKTLDEDPETHTQGLTKSSVSVVIDQLRKKMNAHGKNLPEGFYLTDGQIYQIKISQQGHPYANRLVKLTEPEQVSNGWRTYRFVHTPGVANRIKREHALTREQAKDFGQETSTCIRCGVQLKPEIKTKSGEPRWIGPDCEKKMGWS